MINSKLSAQHKANLIRSIIQDMDFYLNECGHCDNTKTVELTNELLEIFTVYTVNQKTFKVKYVNNEFCLINANPLPNDNPVTFMGFVQINKYLNTVYNCDIDHVTDHVIVL